MIRLMSRGTEILRGKDELENFQMFRKKVVVVVVVVALAGEKGFSKIGA